MNTTSKIKFGDIKLDSTFTRLSIFAKFCNHRKFDFGVEQEDRMLTVTVNKDLLREYARAVDADNTLIHTLSTSQLLAHLLTEQDKEQNDS